MLGSMLISGRRTGQVRLDSRFEDVSFVATKPDSTLEDVIIDAQQKLDSIKASPSPVETEIMFLESWIWAASNPKKEEVKPDAPITGTSGAKTPITEQSSE